MSQSPEYVTVEEMKTRLRSNNHVVPSKSVRAELARLCLQHNLMTEMESLVTRNPRDTRRAWLVAMTHARTPHREAAKRFTILL